MRRLHVELRGNVIQRLGLRRIELLRLYADDLLDLAGMFAHQVEDLELPRFRLVLILRDGGAVLSGRLGQSGEQRRLCQGEVLGGLAEIKARRRLGTVGRMAVVDLVEVPLEDLAIAVASLELEGDRRLFELAREAAVGALRRVDVDVAGKLLRDRAASAPREEPRPERSEVFEGRPREATSARRKKPATWAVSCKSARPLKGDRPALPWTVTPLPPSASQAPDTLSASDSRRRSMGGLGCISIAISLQDEG